jgi:hypothetical protein
MGMSVTPAKRPAFSYAHDMSCRIFQVENRHEKACFIRWSPPEGLELSALASASDPQWDERSEESIRAGWLTDWGGGRGTGGTGQRRSSDDPLKNCAKTLRTLWRRRCLIPLVPST